MTRFFWGNLPRAEQASLLPSIQDCLAASLPSITSHGTDNRRPRFRLPIHPGDRAPDPGVPGLFEDLPLHDPGGATPAGRRHRHHPLRRPEQRVCAERPVARSRAFLSWACRCWAFATASSCSAICSAARRPSSDHREYGHGTLTIKAPGRLFAGLPRRLRVWNSHGDRVTRLPPGFRAIGITENSPFAAIEDRKRNFYGIQFHPEVFHTERGVDVIRNFLVGVCGARQDWSMKNFIAQAVAEIRATVGTGPCHPRPQRRRRFVRGRRPHPPGDRPPAHLRVRGQRPAAPGRARGRGRSLQEAFPHRSARGRRRRACFSAGSRASPIPSRSARSSAGRSSRCSNSR